MSKLNKDLVEGAIDKILAYSSGETIQHDGADVKGKKRKFVETIDLQIALCLLYTSPSPRDRG